MGKVRGEALDRLAHVSHDRQSSRIQRGEVVNMKQSNPTATAIADLRTRQRAIASHYADIAINREELEAQAIANLKAKNLNPNY